MVTNPFFPNFQKREPIAAANQIAEEEEDEGKAGDKKEPPMPPMPAPVNTTPVGEGYTWRIDLAQTEGHWTRDGGKRDSIHIQRLTCRVGTMSKMLTLFLKSFYMSQI